MQAYPRLRDHNAYRFAKAAPAPTRGPWLFESFTENQDGHGSHRYHVGPGQQHRDQHQHPARAGAPNPMRHAETQRVQIRGRAKGGQFAMSVATIETTLLDR